MNNQSNKQKIIQSVSKMIADKEIVRSYIKGKISSKELIDNYIKLGNPL